MSFSVADLITALYPELNATGSSDLMFWATDDLYQWAAEAVRHSSLAGLFADTDASVSLVAGTSVYSNPTGQISMLRFALGNQLLRPTSANELAALSDSWQSDSGTPLRWIEDWQGHSLFRLHPTPTATGSLSIVLTKSPTDVTSGSPTIAAPAVYGDYLSTRMLAEARRQEGDGALPEVAQALDAETSLYEKIFTAYWGTP